MVVFWGKIGEMKRLTFILLFLLLPIIVPKQIHAQVTQVQCQEICNFVNGVPQNQKDCIAAGCVEQIPTNMTNQENNSGITCSGGAAINTAIGCVPFGDQNALLGFILRWALGIGGGIAFLLILVAGFQIMTSRGDPNRLKAGQELMTSAIAGLILLIFSIFVLRLIGVDILGIPGFAK